MNYIFECSPRHLTSKRSKRVRYRVKHEKIKFISTSGHVTFCSLYKHTNDDVFDDFPKIFDHFANISEDFPKLFGRTNERFRTSIRHFPKITEDFRRSPPEEGPLMFRLCFQDTRRPNFTVSHTFIAHCGSYLTCRI